MKVIKSGTINKNEYSLLDRSELNATFLVIKKIQTGKTKEIYQSTSFVSASIYFDNLFNKENTVRIKTDKQIKTEATKNEYRRVFEDMNFPKNIFAKCSNGLQVRIAWRNPNGNFWWDKWTKY